MNRDRNQTYSSATLSLGSEERKEDEEMRHTGIIQSERQVFDLAREFFGGNGRRGSGAA